MSTTKAIKQRLQSNVQRRQKINEFTLWRRLNKAEQIERQYLQLEGQTLEQLLMQTQVSWWDRMFAR